MAPIVIIGGGIVGISLAYYLRFMEDPVIVIEKDQLGSGTTGASIAQFLWHQHNPHETEHEIRSDAWTEYNRWIESEAISFDRVGTLQTAESRSGLKELHKVRESLDRLGIEISVLGSKEISNLGLNQNEIKGGILVPDDGILDPTEIIQKFRNSATQNGVTIRTGTAVTDIYTDDETVTAVETTDGTYQADVTINAAGPWAPAINEMVGLSTQLRHTRGPIVVLKTEQQSDLPLTFFEDGYYFRQEGRTKVLAGNFATEFDEASTLDPDAAHQIGEEFYLSVERRIRETIPAMKDAEIINEWLGIRSVTPDGRPYVGPTSITGYYLACGMNGYGITRAPTVGKVLAEYLRTGKTSQILDYMSPSRIPN